MTNHNGVAHKGDEWGKGDGGKGDEWGEAGEEERNPKAQEARHRHDLRIVSGAKLLGDHSIETFTKCKCTWRLIISNPTYCLHFTRSFRTLRNAVSAAVAILPALKMCDECGKIAGKAEYVEQDYFPFRHKREEKGEEPEREPERE